MDTGVQLISEHGYGALCILLTLGIVGLPIPDEALLMFAGYLVFRGQFEFVPALSAAWAGSVLGITISYVVGRTVGTKGIPKLSHFLHWRPDHIERAEQWVRRWGSYIIVLAYFLPGIRHVGALILGSTAVAFGRFARFAYAGALIWAGTFISLGYMLGEEWSHLSRLVHRSVAAIALAAALVAIGAIVVWKKRLNRQTAGNGEG
jgi:membrane protein DedA with SNARE-associated domain